MAKIALVLPCLWLYCCAATLVSNNDLERMRQLGQNARLGPNLLGRSKYATQHSQLRNQGTSSERALADYLLPNDVVPTSYSLRLVPYFKDAPSPAQQFTVDGHASINVMTQRETSRIVMHALFLQIHAINVTQVSNNAVVGVSGWTLAADDTEFLSVDLATPLPSGEHFRVDVAYTGILNSDQYGFFYSSYARGGVVEYLATTQFQSVNARLTFPCFDQPERKATFTLTLGHDPQYTAIANMPLQSTTAGGPELPSGWVWDTFMETPYMSTYLLAFTVSKFASLQSQKDDRFKVWAKDVSLGDFANEVAPDILNLYQQYTQTDYGMPKVDQVGLEEFWTGAMENWGHVTYIESYLLVDRETSPLEDVQLSAIAMSHELTHQWFGNIVTPQWWSDLWLNEGFATYFEYFGTAQLFPEWPMDEYFQVDMIHTAFVSDETAAKSHPVHAQVDNPESIMAIFDSMSYNKGGCLVRFMLNLLGEDNFHQGIVDYMNKHKYSSVDQADLFAALQAHVPTGLLPDGVSFAQLMDTWTMQAGVPVLTVSRDYPGESAVVAQQRFGVNGAEQWIVPLTWTSQALLDFDTLTPAAWLMTAETQLDVGVPPADQWLLLNVQQTAYYRVNYDQQNWDMLFAFLEDPDTADLIHPLNRAQILDDSFALAKFGHLPYSTALASTKYLRHETTLGPWMAALAGLEFVRDRMYQSTDTQVIFDSYMVSKLSGVFEHVDGLEKQPDESAAKTLTRSAIAKWSCKSGVEKCNQQALAVSKHADVHKAVRGVSYCTGMRHGDSSDFEFYSELYKSATEYQERTDLLGALGCASDVTILKTYLQEILKPASFVKAGDALGVFFSVYSNPLAIDTALDFLIENYHQLRDKLNTGAAFLGICEKLNTHTHYQKIANFIDDNGSKLAEEERMTLKTSLDILGNILDWNSAYFEEVKAFFIQN